MPITLDRETLTISEIVIRLKFWVSNWIQRANQERYRQPGWIGTSGGNRGNRWNRVNRGSRDNRDHRGQPGSK